MKIWWCYQWWHYLWFMILSCSLSSPVCQSALYIFPSLSCLSSTIWAFLSLTHILRLYFCKHCTISVVDIKLFKFWYCALSCCFHTTCLSVSLQCMLYVHLLTSVYSTYNLCSICSSALCLLHHNAFSEMHILSVSLFTTANVFFSVSTWWKSQHSNLLLSLLWLVLPCTSWASRWNSVSYKVFLWYIS